MLYRRVYRANYFADRTAVDFLEVCTDHYLDLTPEVLDELDLLTRHFPIIPHGLDLSLGSRDGLSGDYLERTIELVERVRPTWFSDHIAFTRVGGYELGHLAPVPLTRDSLATLEANIAHVTARTQIPFALENAAATFAFERSELSPGAFVRELVARTGCRLVLDIANLVCDAYNLGSSPEAFLEEIPLEAVVQVHVAGGHVAHGVYIDSHTRQVPSAVWALARRVVDARPEVAITLEREEALPPFAEIRRELDFARALVG